MQHFTVCVKFYTLGASAAPWVRMHHTGYKCECLTLT